MRNIPFVQIERLINKNLGEGYINIEELRRLLKRRFFLVLIQTNRRVIGLALVKEISSTEFFIKTRGAYKVSHPVFILDIMAVDPKFQKRGLGKNLMDEVNVLLKPENWYCFAWKSKDGVHMKRLLKSTGAKLIWKKKGYYYLDSLKKRYTCPVCGNPCKCAVELFRVNRQSS